MGGNAALLFMPFVISETVSAAHLMLAFKVVSAFPPVPFASSAPCPFCTFSAPSVPPSPPVLFTSRPSFTFTCPSSCWFLGLFSPAYHLVLERLHQDILSLLTCSVLTEPVMKTRSYEDVGGEKQNLRRKWQDTKPVVSSPFLLQCKEVGPETA